MINHLLNIDHSHFALLCDVIDMSSNKSSHIGIGNVAMSLNGNIPAPCFVRLLAELAIQHIGVGGYCVLFLPVVRRRMLIFLAYC